MLKSIDVTDDRLDLDSIKSIGIGHEFLTHPKTLAHCRTEFYLSDLMSRDDFTTWHSKGRKILSERLLEIFEKRMQAYVQPDIAPEIVKDLKRYVRARTS
jgi:trimethylamine:corrinoid methyltransferase-like protein